MSVRHPSVLVAGALVAAALVAVPTAPAQAAPVLAAGFSDALVASVAQPTDLAPMPDGRLLVTSQLGQVRVLKDGTLLSTPALDLSSRTCTNSERGVLGIVADPDAASRHVYVYWTVRGSSSTCPTSSTGIPSGGPSNRVSRFTFRSGADTIDPATELVLIDGIPSPAGNHNAGDLGIGKDGMLYVSVGDGGCDYRGDSGCAGNNNASRDRNYPGGKILRITRTGDVPSDNPWTGTGTARCNRGVAATGTTCQEAFAVGLRNPFRIAFDPDASGTTFRINDVGQNIWEEVDQGVKGADYGWNTREGRCANTGSQSNCGPAKPAQFTDPIHVYAHSTGCASITGGAYVPDAAWPAPWNSRYLYADYVCGKIRGLSSDGTVTDLVSGLGGSSAVALQFAPTAAALRDAPGQSLYYTTYAGGGQVRRITATGTANRTPSAALTSSPSSGTAPLTVTLDGRSSSDPDGDRLTYLWSFGDGSPDVTTTTATTSHTYAKGTWTASLRVRDAAGATSSPATATVTAGSRAPTVTITSPAADDLFTVGTSYRLWASATDPEDGALPDSALTWQVLRHHATHTHPYLGPVTGNGVELIGAEPEDLDATQNSYLEIRVTAEDGDGTTTTVTRDFRPTTVPVTLASDPVGRTVTVNGTTVTTPKTLTSWAGYRLSLAIPAQKDSSGRTWAGDGWSDGTAATGSITTPSSATTLTAALSPRGLFARYYPTATLAGAPTQRLDTAVDLDWGTSSPAPAIPADQFSARWSGQLLPQYSETYTVSVVADDSVRMWVGDSYADGWTDVGPQTLTTTVPLTAGVPVRIMLDYRERTGNARVQLRWSSSSQAEQVVPTARLLPRYAYSFRPSASPPPSGWTADDGAAYSSTRFTGFGWSRDLTDRTRDRAVLGDPLRDAFVHTDDATWEAALPSGTYRLRAVSGDPTATDSTHVLDAEGKRLLSGVPTSSRPFVTGSLQVPVTDGRLTVRAGTGGVNVKLNTLTIELR
ncbi:MAG: PQQ-dependent sugar dehydrogenase [Kineosporiaceae bacterium]